MGNYLACRICSLTPPGIDIENQESVSQEENLSGWQSIFSDSIPSRPERHRWHKNKNARQTSAGISNTRRRNWLFNLPFEFFLDLLRPLVHIIKQPAPVAVFTFFCRRCNGRLGEF